MIKADSLAELETKVTGILAQKYPEDKKRFEDILARAEAAEGLDLVDAAYLLRLSCPEDKKRVIETARRVKEKIFGERVVLFAPLYLTNHCINNCLYCGFRKENKNSTRKSLSPEEAVKQCSILSEKGYRRVLLVCGEVSEKAALDSLEKIVGEIYQKSGVRILHVNMAPLSQEGFDRLKKLPIGVYQIFQETYHRATYKTMHPSGPKADYDWRLNGMDRAMSAGLGDVGIGALYGLYEPDFETLALIYHSQYLTKTFGSAAHTVSVPRLRPAEGALITESPYSLSDEHFKLTVAVLRLALPTTGIVLTTRENSRLRREFLHCGISQISAGSSTEPGGYTEGKGEEHELSQFEIDDTRSIEEVVHDIVKEGLLPSLCTACYREGRTGVDFHAMAKTGEIQDFCSENALFSLLEYAIDHKDKELQDFVEKRLAKEKNVVNNIKEGSGKFTPANATYMYNNYL